MPSHPLIDSHCHIDFPELAGRIPQLLEHMAAADVVAAVCVAVTAEGFPALRTLAESDPRLWATVGVHPDHLGGTEPSEDWLLTQAAHPKVIAIGETGLDYFRLKGDLEWQRARFRTHIRAAIRCGKPLIIHTRESAADTLKIMREEGAGQAGGIMHCFTETLGIAEAAVDLGFYISFSGILSFKSAEELRAVARALPLDRLLVETDAPYLAPMPHRGKTNEPAYVRHVAQALADARGIALDQVAQATTENFYRLFPQTRP